MADLDDLDIFRAMLRRADVKFSDDVKADGSHGVIIYGANGLNNLGYVGFYALFHFSVGGRLRRVGVWE